MSLAKISDGRYLIRSFAGRQPLIGVDGYDGSGKPVISDGEENVWTIRSLPEKPGTYTISLRDGYSLQGEGDNVVVGQPAQVWSIGYFAENDAYAIGKDTSIYPFPGWTLTNAEVPKSPVVLKLVDIAFPTQLWKIIPILE